MTANSKIRLFKNQKSRSQYKRSLRLESLEERALLSVTPLSADEYADLRAQYAEFDLPENMADLNVITLDLAEGDGLTELKSAISTAGTTAKSDLIVVRTSDTANTIQYTAAEDELIIGIDASEFGSVTIVGLGSKPLSLDADGKCRVMTVSGTDADHSTIANLGGLTITNGKSSNSSSNKSYGGGIYNSYGTLTVTNSTISGNTASSAGGGIFNNNGTLTVTNSTISGNTASFGGGIYNSSSSRTLTVTNSTISGNTASFGGGIGNYGTLTVTNSTISGNTASSNCGGIYNYGTLTVTNSTISENTASSGGGIYNSSSSRTLTVTNSTISGNTASVDGGGIYYYSGTLTVTNSTISGNKASENGDGIYSYNYSGTNTAIFNNSIVIDAIYIEKGTISGSYNLSSFTDWSSGSNNITYNSSKPLFVNAANGDYHLVANSQAIDKGSNALAVDATSHVLAHDLDNLSRIVNNTVDIGAYEYRALAAPTLSAAVTGSDSIKVTVGEVENGSTYTLEYSTSSDFTNAESQNVSAGDTTITGLSPNKTYYFHALAVGTGNYTDSVFSASASAKTDKAQLATPTLSASVKKTTVTFSWNAVPNASGYDFQYKAEDGDWISEIVEGTSFSFEGTLHTEYTARVMALGEGDYTDSDVSEQQSITVPEITTSIEGKKVTVDWVDDSPAADSVRYRVAGTTKWTTKKLKAGVTTFSFNGKLGTDYEIEVLLDQQEAKVFQTTAVVLDQAKLKADKAAIQDDTFQVSVTNYAAKNLADNATQALVTVNGVQTAFDIENQEGSAELENGGNVAFADGLFTFTGMNSNTAYKVQVAFTDGLSVSTPSSALSVKTLKAPYLAPVLTSATATSDTSVVVEWESAVGKDTDTPAQKYTVQYSLDGVKWTNATTAATGNSFTIQKLKGGNMYQVRVLATKDSAFEASAPSDVLMAETLALPVTALDKTTVQDDTFQVSVTNYPTTNLLKAAAVNVTTDQFGTAQIWLRNYAGSGTLDKGVTVAFENGALTFMNAPSNTQMKVQVSFALDACTTALSKALTVKTTIAPYLKPTLTSVTAVSSTSVTVAWETVYGKNTTEPAQYYTVQYSLDGEKWTNATTKATGNSFTIQRLKPGTQYLIAVLATKDSKFNASEPSDAQLVTTLE